MRSNQVSDGQKVKKQNMIEASKSQQTKKGSRQALK